MVRAVEVVLPGHPGILALRGGAYITKKTTYAPPAAMSYLALPFMQTGMAVGQAFRTGIDVIEGGGLDFYGGFVGAFLNGRPGGLGLMALGIATFMTDGEAEGAIKISEGRLTKVLETHTAGGVLATANKSLFNSTEEVRGLIQAAESVDPVGQVGGNFERIVDAGRIIGTDRTTGQATSIYTVITDASGNLITAFPGKP